MFLSVVEAELCFGGFASPLHASAGPRTGSQPESVFQTNHAGLGTCAYTGGTRKCASAARVAAAASSLKRAMSSTTDPTC